MRRFLTLFALALALTLCANAQPAVRDSLLRLVPSAKEDTTAVKLYLQIGRILENTDPPAARTYYSRASRLGRKLRDTGDILRSMMRYSSTFLVEGKIDSMLYYDQQALTLARQARDSLQIGMALFNIGIAYRENSDFENAIAYCLQGRTIIEARGDKKIAVQMNDNLQLLYYSRTEYDKAIEFGEITVRQARELNKKALLGQALENLSMSYSATGRLQETYAALQEALQIGVDLEDTRIQGYALLGLGGYFMRKKDFKQVRMYAQRSLDLQKKIGTENGETGALRSIAISYLQEGKYTEAEKYAEMDLAICKKNHDKREESLVLRLMSCIAYARHDFDNGLEYNTRGGDTLEAMVKEVLSEKSADLEKKYLTEKKETKIRQLEADKKVQQLSIRQKDILNYILFGSATLLLVVSFLLYRNYRQKQRIQQQRIIELETEKRLTATEAVLKGEEQERTRLAQELHDGLGGMLSGIKYSFKAMQGNMIMTPENGVTFERSMDMLDSSIKEMRRVAHNMMPEALVKFGLDAALRDFCNDITKSGALQVNYISLGLEMMIIEQTMAITIYRIVQELLNNTIKHAAAKMAIVQLIKSNGQLALTVEDDGKGFDTEILPGAEGIGWTIIRNRVEFLKGQLHLHSETGKGSSIQIELPIS